MGYLFVMSPCFVCKRLFTYNPDRVPSFTTEHGREPICKPCIEIVNRRRVENGLPPWPVYADAYEPVEA